MSEGCMSPLRRTIVPDGLPSPKRMRPSSDLEDASTTAVLVYNISLNDLLVATQPIPERSKGQTFPDGLPGLARPLFSAQLALATSIAEVLVDDPVLVTWPEARTRSTAADQREPALLPLGFELPEGRGDDVLSVDLLRFRRLIDSAGAESPDTDGFGESSCPLFSHHIRAVFFPLLSAVVTAWLRGAAVNADRRVVVLVSGRAEPRDEGADAQGNSTERTAELMVRFLAAAYGKGPHNVIGSALHSDVDANQYDGNLKFCHQLLLPLLDAEREEVACRYGDRWPDKFHVTLALCDGTHSRLQVLSQCLREFRPVMSHLTPVKAFWHSCVLRPSDVDCVSYERAFESAPSILVATLTDPALAAVIAEISAHRNSFLFAQPHDVSRGLANSSGMPGSPVLGPLGHFSLGPSMSGGEDPDIESFWLRKTRKPVLSVLLVQRGGGPLRMHRGINLEVSMPTGSLCAERNVIGTAFAADPSLRREDLRAMAVLAIDCTRSEGTPLKGRNPLAPCGACMEWLRKIYEVNPSFRVLMFEDELCKTVLVKTVGRLR